MGDPAAPCPLWPAGGVRAGIFSSENEVTTNTEILLIVSALVFGLRHGIDWDHVAAITDITGSQDSAQQSMWLGTVYALGHGTVITLLGLLAVSVGVLLPKWVDDVMEHVVGMTLLILGLYVIYSLIKDGRNFKLRSRWMLIFDWAEIGYHGLISKLTGVKVERPERQRNYSLTTAYLVGVIHGIGAETPTQVLLFIAAAGAAGERFGVLLVLTFILGLVVSNSIITILSTFGFLRARKNAPVLMVLGSLTAAFSLTVGTIFLFGQGSILPALFGG